MKCHFKRYQYWRDPEAAYHPIPNNPCRLALRLKNQTMFYAPTHVASAPADSVVPSTLKRPMRASKTFEQILQRTSTSHNKKAKKKRQVAVDRPFQRFRKQHLQLLWQQIISFQTRWKFGLYITEWTKKSVYILSSSSSSS